MIVVRLVACVKEECKSLISSMKNVKMSPHGDVILMDGL